MTVRSLVRLGECTRCGDCCDLSKLTELGDVIQVGPCRWLAWEGSLASCRIQGHKPLACREFPESPECLIGLSRCGYWFVDEKGVRVDAWA